MPCCVLQRCARLVPRPLGQLCGSQWRDGACAVQAALRQLDSQRSPDNVACVLRLLEEGLAALRRRGTGACAQALPAAVSRVAPLLAAESDAVRHGATTTLVAVLGSCVTEEMVAADALDAAMAGARPGGLQRVMAALTGMLGASYRDAWPGVMRVLAAAFDALGPPGQHLVQPALARLADMCRCDATCMHACADVGWGNSPSPCRADWVPPTLSPAHRAFVHV